MRKEVQGKLSGKKGRHGCTLDFPAVLWGLETVGHEEVQYIPESHRQTAVLSHF